jgi:hypothetical protein
VIDLKEATARRIIDTIASAIDKKPSSAKTFKKGPFTEQADLSWWDEYNLPNDTPRTEALTIAYLLFSGGRIPLQGIQMQDAYFRPDQYIVGAFLKNGRFRHDEDADELVFTQQGWEWMAGVLEQIRIA